MGVHSIFVVAVGLFVGFFHPGPVRAADDRYPARAIEAVVPFPPGGVVDVGARIIANSMSEHLRVAVAVVNRTGAGGLIGASSVANAAPDGYTVGFLPNSVFTLLELSNRSMPYKIQDFVPLGIYGFEAIVVIVHADSAQSTFEDLVSSARQNPGKLNYGTAGTGGVAWYVGEVIGLHHGLQMEDVPFKGSPQAMMAVVGKQVNFSGVALSVAAPLIKAGRLRALAVATNSRLPGHSNIPTLAEKGVQNATMSLTLGLYVRAGTPRRTVEVLGRSLAVAMKKDSVIKDLDKAGIFAGYADGNGARRQLEAEYRRVQEFGRKLKTR